MAAHNDVTLGLSSHRPEMVPIISEWMSRHDVIFLEEPPAPGFDKMLAGILSVADYLLDQDVAFPAFSADMCNLLQRLNAEGKKIYQVEPYLDILADIHEFFAAGHSPDEIDRSSARYPVYLAERNATGALLSFYKASGGGDFDHTVEAVKTFARFDAARFRLRDSLRSQELVRRLAGCSSAFVEAGEMHYPLYHLLRKALAGGGHVRPVFMYRQVPGQSSGTGTVYGPGDRLTLRYIYHPAQAPNGDSLLAARSLIHSKIAAKEEYTHRLDFLPHLENERRCNRLVDRLTMDDCRKLFHLIRRADTQTANQLVAEYVDRRCPEYSI